MNFSIMSGWLGSVGYKLYVRHGLFWEAAVEVT